MSVAVYDTHDGYIAVHEGETCRVKLFYEACVYIWERERVKYGTSGFRSHLIPSLIPRFYIPHVYHS